MYLTSDNMLYCLLLISKLLVLKQISSVTDPSMILIQKYYILNFLKKIQHSQINLPYIYCLHFFQPFVLVKPWRFRVHWEIRFIWKEEKNYSEKLTLGSRYKMWSGSQQTDDLLGRQLQKHPGDEWLWRNE